MWWRVCNCYFTIAIKTVLHYIGLDMIIIVYFFFSLAMFTLNQFYAVYVARIIVSLLLLLLIIHSRFFFVLFFVLLQQTNPTFDNALCIHICKYVVFFCFVKLWLNDRISCVQQLYDSPGLDHCSWSCCNATIAIQFLISWAKHAIDKKTHTKKKKKKK